MVGNWKATKGPNWFLNNRLDECMLQSGWKSGVVKRCVYELGDDRRHYEHVYSPSKAETQTETDYVQQSHTIKIIQ